MTATTLQSKAASRVDVVGDEVRLALPDGVVRAPIQGLPQDKIDWIDRGRRAAFAQLLGEGGKSLRLGCHSFHMPVVTTSSPDELIPFDCGKKGVGYLPKQEYLEEFIEMFEEVHERTRDRPWKEALRERVKTVKRFYFSPAKIDYRVLSTVEVYEPRTFRNLWRRPVASLLYTGASPDYISFQVNAAVEIVPQGDPRHTFLMRLRMLFSSGSESYRSQRSQFPYAYLYWICGVRDTKQTGHIRDSEVPAPCLEDGLEWTPKALAAISRSPSLIQKLLRERIEDQARERGRSLIDYPLVLEAEQHHMNGRA